MTKRPRLVAIVVVVFLSGIALGVLYWRHSQVVEENRAFDIASGYWKTGAFSEAAPRLWSLVNRGNAAAYRQLAYMYARGLGVARDREFARTLYLRSDAEPGETFYHLGKLFDGAVHETGFQIQRDEIEAIYWYYAAATRGHRAAALLISLAYRDGGYRLERDAAKAEYWRKRSEGN